MHPLERTDNSHLEALRHFEEPMQDFYQMSDQLSRITNLTMALKLGLFDALQTLGNNRSAKVLKEHLKLKFSDRHFYDFLDKLFVYGYLERSGGILDNALYKCSNYTTKYLLGKEDSSYSGVFKNLLWDLENFSNIEGTIKSGKEVLYTDVIYKDECKLRNFVDLFCKSNELNFQNLINNVDFSRFNRIVDIHGMVGMLAKMIRQKFKNCEIISFENKNIKTLCEEKQKTYNIHGEVKFEYGDLLKDKIPECDCVIAPMCFQWYSGENREKIQKMIFERLKEGGTLIVMDHFIDEERKKDSCGLKHSACMAIHGMEGFEKSFLEANETLTRLGFSDVEFVQRECGYADIVIARK